MMANAPLVGELGILYSLTRQPQKAIENKHTTNTPTLYLFSNGSIVTALIVMIIGQIFPLSKKVVVKFVS